jgi:hypothetical protein
VISYLKRSFYVIPLLLAVGNSCAKIDFDLIMEEVGRLPNYTKVEGQRLGTFNYLANDGFAYLREKEKEGILYLRCKFGDRKNLEGTCDARATVDLQTDQLRCNKAHKCTPNPLDFEVLKAKNEMKKAAASSSNPFSQLHRSVLEKASPGVATKIPIKKVINGMKAARRKT